MQRRHYQAIAQTVFEARRYMNEEDRSLLAAEMASSVAQFNPNFDRSRFIAACISGSK